MPIRVATLPVAAGAQVFYAEDLGYFKNAGLDVNIRRIENSRHIAEAIVSNEVDIGHVNFVSIAKYHATKTPLIVVAPGGVYTSENPATAVVVADGSPIRSAKDLNGKTVATQGLGTINEYGTRAWIEQNAGDPASVKFVEIKFADKVDELAAGHVDAAIVTEPYLEVAKKRNTRVLGYPFDAIAKRFPVNAWATTPQWKQSQPDLVQRFAAVMRDAAKWANANRAKSGEILAKYTNVQPPVPTVVYAEDADFSADMIQPQINVLAAYGNFERFPAAELLETG